MLIINWVVEFRQILLTACRILGTQNKAAAAISERGGRKGILSPPPNTQWVWLTRYVCVCREWSLSLIHNTSLVPPSHFLPCHRPAEPSPRGPSPVHLVPAQSTWSQPSPRGPSPVHVVPAQSTWSQPSPGFEGND